MTIISKLSSRKKSEFIKYGWLCIDIVSTLLATYLPCNNQGIAAGQERIDHFEPLAQRPLNYCGMPATNISPRAECPRIFLAEFLQAAR
jgi:hypothetical protein